MIKIILNISDTVASIVMTFIIVACLFLVGPIGHKILASLSYNVFEFDFLFLNVGVWNIISVLTFMWIFTYDARHDKEAEDNSTVLSITFICDLLHGLFWPGYITLLIIHRLTGSHFRGNRYD